MVLVSWSGVGSRPDDHVHRLPHRKAFLGVHRELGDPTYTPHLPDAAAGGGVGGAWPSTRFSHCWAHVKARGTSPSVRVRLVGEAAQGASVKSRAQSNPNTSSPPKTPTR